MRSTNIICVGCDLTAKYEPSSKDIVNTIYDGAKRLFFVCADCDPFSSLDEDNQFGTILGRGFDFHALGICDVCGNLYTFDVRRFKPLELHPQATYTVQCPCCNPGAKKVRFFSEVALSLAEKEAGILKYDIVRDVNQEFNTETGEVALFTVENLKLADLVLDIVMALLKEPESRITRSDVAELIGTSPATAARYLNRLVDEGYLQKSVGRNNVVHYSLKSK